MSEAKCRNCEVEDVATGSKGRTLAFCSVECRREFPKKAARLRRDNASTLTHKDCNGCARHLPLSEFHTDKRRVDGRYPWCKDCRRSYSGAAKARPSRFGSHRERERHRRENADPAWLKSNARKSYLWTTYRMTPEEYEELHERQSGLCALCKGPEKQLGRGGALKRLSIDHDHACCPGDKSCGACIRGLLCMSCNSLLGHARDSSEILLSALEYLNERRGHG